MAAGGAQSVAKGAGDGEAGVGHGEAGAPDAIARASRAAGLLPEADCGGGTGRLKLDSTVRRLSRAGRLKDGALLDMHLAQLQLLCVMATRGAIAIAILDLTAT
jgi:hypothetical protein